MRHDAAPLPGYGRAEMSRICALEDALYMEPVSPNTLAGFSLSLKVFYPFLWKNVTLKKGPAIVRFFVIFNLRVSGNLTDAIHILI